MVQDGVCSSLYYSIDEIFEFFIPERYCSEYSVHSMGRSFMKLKVSFK
jgi:hypothetical protein